MKLYTSHPPVLRRQQGGHEAGLDYLRRCVTSWTGAGFDLVSVNDPAEIADCRRLDLDLTYVPCARGRPRIADLLDCILKAGDRSAGIINADCLFLGSPRTRAALAGEAQGSMILLERLNIDPATGELTGRSCFGFDAFLFDTDVLRRVAADREFRIGEPWWDYWLPMSFALAGGSLKRSRHPLLTHIDHPTGYSQEQYVHHGRRMYRRLAHCCGLSGEGPDASLVDPQVIGAFACLSYGWIRSRAPSIDFRAASEEERRIGETWSQRQREAIAHATRIDADAVPASGPELTALDWRRPRRSDRRLGEFCCTLARFASPATRSRPRAERLRCRLHRLGAALQLRASIKGRNGSAAGLESLSKLREINEARSRLPVVEA